ncbi:uncharacterized protein [Dendropsophus ebraccatus]|uniref:uncharacterized protein n=1 Tax=Dendropsophus ebraccatus TaxID=150705 RepID=UPI003831E70C
MQLRPRSQKRLFYPPWLNLRSLPLFWQMPQPMRSDSQPGQQHHQTQPEELFGLRTGLAMQLQKQKFAVFRVKENFCLGQNWTNYWRRQEIKRRGFPPPFNQTPIDFFVPKVGVDSVEEDRTEEEEVEDTVNLGATSSTKNPIPIRSHLPSNTGIRVGGRLKFFAQEWKKICGSSWVLRYIQEGVDFDFISRPPTRFVITKSQMGEVGAKTLEKEVISLIDKDVLVPVPHGEIEQGFYSTLFLVQKPDLSFRVIINLKPLNRFLKYQRFKMESIKSTINLLQKNCFMASIDLKDAYLHVPIHKQYQKYLRIAIRINNNLCHLQFQALPFGIAIAPRVFTKIIAEMAAHIREGPAQQKRFLGIDLDSSSQKSYLPEDKIRKLRDTVTAVLQNPRITIRKGMSLLGLFTAAIPAVPWALIHSRPLQRRLLEVWDGSPKGLDKKTVIPHEVTDSLSWWLVEKNLTIGLGWNMYSPILVTTDASPRGWGAHLGELDFQGSWDGSFRDRSSNYRELAAILEALKSAKHYVKNSNVKILSDNSTSVALVNKQGTTKSTALLDLCYKIFSFAEKKSTILISGSPKRNTKHQGRLPQPEFTAPGRMATKPGSFSHDHGLMGNTGGGSIRHKSQPAGDKVLFAVSPGPASSNRRIVTDLEVEANVCLSAVTSSSKGTEEDKAGQGQGDSSGSLLAQKSVVFLPNSDVHIRPMGSPGPSGSSSSGASAASTSGQAPLDGLALERLILKGTTTIDLDKPNLAAILDFLQKGLEKGLKAATLKAHSTRAVSTSWAEKGDVSLEQICKAATWSSPHTFFRHYRLDLSSTSDISFGRRVLQAVVPP